MVNAKIRDDGGGGRREERAGVEGMLERPSACPRPLLRHAVYPSQVVCGNDSVIRCCMPYFSSHSTPSPNQDGGLASGGAALSFVVFCLPRSHQHYHHYTPQPTGGGGAAATARRPRHAVCLPPCFSRGQSRADPSSLKELGRRPKPQRHFQTHRRQWQQQLVVVVQGCRGLLRGGARDVAK